MNAIGSGLIALMLAVGGPAAGAVQGVATPPAVASKMSVPGLPGPTGDVSELGGAPTGETARPEWVDEPSGLGPAGIYVMHVRAGPGFTRSECEDKLKAAIEQRLAAYIAEALPVGTPAAVPLDVDRLRSRLVSRTWEERARAKDFDVVYLHAELRIDDKLRREWQEQAITAIREDRSRIVLAGYMAVTAAAVAAWVLLKWSGRRAAARSGLLPAIPLVAIIVVGAAWLCFRLAA